jgi:hypothetical protein
VIGDEWIEREAEPLGGNVRADDSDAGLLGSIDALGNQFDPA